MKIKLLQNYDNRLLKAGMTIDRELPESVKRELVKQGKAEEVKAKKAVKDDQNAQ